MSLRSNQARRRPAEGGERFAALERPQAVSVAGDDREVCPPWVRHRRRSVTDPQTLMSSFGLHDPIGEPKLTLALTSNENVDAGNSKLEVAFRLALTLMSPHDADASPSSERSRSLLTHRRRRSEREVQRRPCPQPLRPRTSERRLQTRNQSPVNTWPNA